MEKIGPTTFKGSIFEDARSFMNFMRCCGYDFWLGENDQVTMQYILGPSEGTVTSLAKEALVRHHSRLVRLLKIEKH